MGWAGTRGARHQAEESRARGRRRAGGPPLPLWHEGLSHRPWVPAPRDQVRRRALWASWAMGGCREARPGPRKCRWSTEGSRARERAGGHTLLIRQDEVSGARAPLPTGLWGVGWGAWPPGSSVWGGSALGPCPRPGRPGPAHPQGVRLQGHCHLSSRQPVALQVCRHVGAQCRRASVQVHGHTQRPACAGCVCAAGPGAWDWAQSLGTCARWASLRTLLQRVQVWHVCASCGVCVGQQSVRSM